QTGVPGEIEHQEFISPQRRGDPEECLVIKPLPAPAIPPFRTGGFPGTDLKAGLNLARQGAEVAYALQFIIRQLNMKMIFQLGQQIQRLQAVDAEGLEEIVVGRESFARHLEVGRGQAEYFVKRLFGCWHKESF